MNKKFKALALKTKDQKAIKGGVINNSHSPTYFSSNGQDSVLALTSANGETGSIA